MADRYIYMHKYMYIYVQIGTYIYTHALTQGHKYML